MPSSSRLSLQKNLAIAELLKTIWQLPAENQLALADKIRKKALRIKWDDFIQRSDANAGITDEEIISEVKSVRAARYARRKK